VLAGLLLAIPLSRLTSSVQLGDAARAKHLFLIPEETNPPRELRQIHERMGFRQNTLCPGDEYKNYLGLLQVVLDPYVHAIHVALLRLRGDGARREQARLSRIETELLSEGPQNLAPEEMTALLWDPESLAALHKRLWMGSPETLAHWWLYALRHYNELSTITSRRNTA
jgi:membrane glycosyltransferase